MGGVPVAVAIIVGLVSSFVQSIGLTIQRKSHLTNDTLPQISQRRPIRRPLWLLGFGIYISSNVFSTIFQLDALPIVILAPLGAVSLIFNALTARVLLGDTFGPSWIAGTALVAGGAVLIAVFGVVKEDEHGLDEILRLFARKPFVGFFSVECVVTILVLLAAHIAAYHVQRQSNRIALPLSGESTPPPTSIPPSNYASPHSPAPIPFRQTQQRRWSSPTSIEFSPAALSNDHDVKSSPFKLSRFPSFLRKKSSNNPSPSPCITNENVTPEDQRTLTLCGLAFAACSGTLSGMCLVLAKAAVELLVITLDHFRTGRGVNEFARVQTWFLVGGLAVCAILQLVYLNYSLAFASPALICPLAFCFFNLSSIFDGLVFYDQFGRLATYQIVLVSLGVAILLLGVWVVSAIQPGGGAGVEVGTWVEEESVCSVDIDEEPLLGGMVSSEPEPEAGALVVEDGREERNTIGLFGPSPISPEANSSDRMIQSYPQPQAQNEGTESPLHRSVFSEPQSPSPLSPTFRRRSHHLHHQHRTRYGTLIPDLAPAGAPTGFSIGLGAASPGFVLRSASISVPHPNDGLGHGHGHGHRHGSESGHRWSYGRSQSETPAGLMAIIRNAHAHSHPHGSTSGGGAGDAVPPSRITGGESSPDMQGEDNRTEAALRDWDQSNSDNGNESRRGWWSSLFGRNRKRGIRLEE